MANVSIVSSTCYLSMRGWPAPGDWVDTENPQFGKSQIDVEEGVVALQGLRVFTAGFLAYFLRISLYIVDRRLVLLSLKSSSVSGGTDQQALVYSAFCFNSPRKVGRKFLGFRKISSVYVSSALSNPGKSELVRRSLSWMLEDMENGALRDPDTTSLVIGPRVLANSLGRLLTTISTIVAIDTDQVTILALVDQGDIGPDGAPTDGDERSRPIRREHKDLHSLQVRLDECMERYRETSLTTLANMYLSSMYRYRQMLSNLRQSPGDINTGVVAELRIAAEGAGISGHNSKYYFEQVSRGKELAKRFRRDLIKYFMLLDAELLDEIVKFADERSGSSDELTDELYRLALEANKQFPNYSDRYWASVIGNVCGESRLKGDAAPNHGPSQDQDQRDL